MKMFFSQSVSFLLVSIFTILLTHNTTLAETDNFSDVPSSHWAYNDILTLREMDLTQGVGNNTFGMGRPMTRAEFVTFLAKLLQWETRSAAEGEPWYAVYVDAAAEAGAVTGEESVSFRPGDPITREEIAVMLIRSLGYESLALQLNTLPAPFDDVVQNIGYTTMAKDFGIVSGMSGKAFSPSSSATREQGAAMMVRLYNLLSETVGSNPASGWINAFYAIKSSDQSGLISLTDSVSFGWSRVEWRDGVYINMSSAQNNEYSKPEGYETVLSDVRSQSKQALLMVTVENKTVLSADSPDGAGQPLSAYLLNSEQLRRRMVSQIAAAAADFDGVTIDFENLRGSQARQDFSVFLTELKATLTPRGNLMYVAVQPARQPGQSYYDGYDFRGIGRVADKVILMAHDYYPKSLTDEEMESGFNVTPLSPINEVYYALKAIADPVSGVEDTGKVLLQFSFDSAQWKLQNGRIINREPFHPAYEAIQSRVSLGASRQYSLKYESPFVTFIDEDDQTDNIVWYENSRSVTAKLNLAAMFGIKGVSLWRLGLIPDDAAELFE
ncbi:MAG: S-layer homology domain-containing protein [Clostridiales bacterium]|jgi:spore germination protein YaaH|nr:S-layer homology domain-containing protein [Clostridiales bacterium]